MLLPVGADDVRVEVDPDEVLEEDEPVDVRVEAAGAAVRVLFVDSRLIVVVRPFASVLLMVVRVVPDLLTRLSTVVEGATVRVEVEPEEVRVVAVPEEVRVEVVVLEVVRVEVVVEEDEGEDVRPEVVVVVVDVRCVAVPEA